MNATMNGNGKAHAQADKTDTPVYSLRIFRVEPGSTIFARFLAYSPLGVYTHFARGRSHLCQGEECNPLYHKTDKVWKGYAPVELWNDARKVWCPYVLEVSEHLELDFRGICARGQVWELFRLEQSGRKATPVQGKLQEERDPASMPTAFEILPVLKTVYHCMKISLTHANPLPPRVYVTDSKDAGPVALASKGYERDTRSTAEVVEELKRKRAAMNGTATPTEKKNGRP